MELLSNPYFIWTIILSIALVLLHLRYTSCERDRNRLEVLARDLNRQLQACREIRVTNTKRR